MTRIPLYLSGLIITAALLPFTPRAHAQSLSDFKEFYRMYRYNAVEQMVFCYPTETQASEPSCIGVKRDEAGRPIQLTRFRFGNLDTRADWVTMRIEHAVYDSLKLRTERRSFFGVGGVPISMWKAFTEEVTYRLNGQIVQRKLLDRAGKPANDSSGVHRALYQLTSPNNYIVQWYVSNGKLHHGAGADGPGRPFGMGTAKSYYRKFVVDDRGDLGREELMDLYKQPTPFPTGEFIHMFSVNDCGQRIKMRFVSQDMQHMTDTHGVAWYTYQYDTAGRMIEWRSFSEDHNPYARPSDGLAGMRYVYRAFDGVLLKEERLGADGNVLP